MHFVCDPFSETRHRPDLKPIVNEIDKIVVIALGNRFRADDAAGLEVAARLNRNTDSVTIVDNATDAFAIVDAWDGAALSVVVDAAVTGANPGTVHRVEVDAELLPKDLSRCSSHGMGVAEAFELAKAVGRLPRKLLIYGIEVKSVTLGEPLSPEVTKAVASVARQIDDEIAGTSNR